MAIYHLHAKLIQRSKGRNAVAAAAYRRAATLFDDREQRDWDYSNKPDVVHSELIVPDNAPEWAKALVELHATSPSEAAEKLWNLVESYEKRVDSQLAREVEFALPIELTQEQNILLAREFVHDQFALRGMVADFNVHWDNNNPHVHVMLSMRELAEDGFGLKVREWNSKGLLQTWREKWSEYVNFHLRLHQHDMRIDHRSYEAQGIELVPTIHQGKAVSDMDARGIPTAIMLEANAIRRENLARIADRPEILLDKLSMQTETFTGQQLGQELGRYVNDQGKFSLQDNGILAQAALRDFDNLDNWESFEKGVVLQDGLADEKIGKIFQLVEHHESVFTEKAIANAVLPFTNNAKLFAKAVLQVKASPELLYLGAGDDGRDRFTTRRMFKLENEIQQTADYLRNSRHVKITDKRIDEALENHQNRINKKLTGEQLAAVKHVLQPSSISCIVGRAGTGKSFSLGAAKAVWEAQGLRVQGVALSGIAADGLNKDAGIESRTIDSFRYAIENGTIGLNRYDVIVMDEAGMTDSESMLAVLTAIRESGAKLVLVGDHAQIQPVGPGASFRALLERLGFSEIQTIYRQKEEWQRSATSEFAAGRVASGLRAYEEKSCVHLEKTAESAMSRLVDDWSSARETEEKALSDYLVIAHRNDDVRLLNKSLRAERTRRNEIAEGHEVTSSLGKINIAQGDRLLFLKNNRRLGVSNGRFATIKSVDFTETGVVRHFTVVLDEADKGAGKEVRILPNEYAHFTYGYAATVHKVQGITVDRSFVYAGGAGWNRNLTYVAMSRHRDACHLYADKETHKSTDELHKHLGRYSIKDSLLDFPLAFAERRGIETEKLTKLLPQHLAERLKTLKGKISDRVEEAFLPEQYAKRRQSEANPAFALEQPSDGELEAIKIAERREDARLVAAYVDVNAEVGKAWQSLQTKLTALGLDGITYEKEAYRLISGSQEHAAFQEALRARDEKAFAIIQGQQLKGAGHYAKVIEIYGLDQTKLQKQADGHSAYTRVGHYNDFCKTGRVVHRDRLASEIMQNIKAHYAAMQALQLNARDVKAHATAHLKRQLFRTLMPEERATFKTVEAYQAAVQKAGAWWAAEIKDKTFALSHSVLEKLEAFSSKRDRLAHQILKDRARYDKALDFYQIGMAVPHYEEKPTEQDIKQAEARWYKLQQSAARYELRERVETYQRALYLGDVNSRIKLAQEIVENASAHHGAVIELRANTSEIWSAIRRDAKRYEQFKHYQNLDLVERAGFKDVESYMDAKRAHGNAWWELIKMNENLKMDDKHFYQSLAPFAARYTRERDKLAAGLLKAPELYQAGLEYFKITLEELQPQAYKYTCYDNVQNYIHATDFLTRANYALALVASPKSHHGNVLENNLDWKGIYRDARIAERKQLFDRSSSEEKAFYRLVDEYRAINQNAGRVFSSIKTKLAKVQQTAAHTAQSASRKAPAPLSAQAQQRIDHLFAKRDYLAWRLVNSAYAIDSQFLNNAATPHRLKVDKLLQQHAQHGQRLAAVGRCQAAHQDVVNTTRVIHAENGLKSKEETTLSLRKAFNAIISAEQLQKMVRYDKPAPLNYALHMYGLSQNDLIKQKQSLAALKEHLQSQARLNDVDTKKLIEKPPAHIFNQFQENKNNFQRIDVNRLREDLNARAEEVVKHYLGEPKARSGGRWHYGSNKGSLVITVRGQRQGTWRDFQTSEGGDMLSLIGHATGTTQFKDILHEASRFLGGHSAYIQPAITTNQTTKNTKAEEFDADILKRINHAKTIFQGSRPIAGTLGERYLREHRGIQGEIYDKTFRFHPELKNWVTGDVLPAVVLAARNEKDEVVGVQAIFLDPATAKKAPLGHNAKLSRGLTSEGAIVRQGLPTGKIAFAEGPETALSVAEAHPDWTVYVTFGVSNFEKVPLKTKAKSVLICADNDGINSGTAKSVAKTANALSDNGIDVWVAEPQKPDDINKWDFNDSLIKHGVEQVRKELDSAILMKTGITQESVATAIKQSLSALEKSTAEFNAETAAQQSTDNEIISEEKTEGQISEKISAEALLSQYVDMELEQSRLVNAMYMAKLNDPKNSHEFAARALSHSTSMKAFAADVANRPDIKAEIEKLKEIRPMTLPERGGFIAIKDRIAKGDLTKDDINVLLVQLRNKAWDHARAQVQKQEQDRDRGGRKR